MLTSYQLNVLKEQFKERKQIHVTTIEDARQFAKYMNLTDKNACIIEETKTELFYVEPDTSPMIRNHEVQRSIAA